MAERNDDPNAMMQLTGKHAGERALLVLGGPSGVNWQKLASSLAFDFVIGVNGVNGQIPQLDYWLCIENMQHTFSQAQKHKNKRYIAIMEMFLRTGAKIRLVNDKSYRLLKDQSNVIKVRRAYGLELEYLPEEFSVREYGRGLLVGPSVGREGVDAAELTIGTVGLQGLHLAGILGVAEVHTIGFDLMLAESQHWYEYPKTYQPGRYFNEKSFIDVCGAQTTWQWFDTAEYLRRFIPFLEAEGVRWVDHSNGLLQKMEIMPWSTI
jgi:hypothetical protein